MNLRPGVRWRRRWLHLHRWVGLAMAAVLLSTAASGALLLLARPADEARPAHLSRPSPAASAALNAVVASMRQEFGSAAAFTLHLPPREGEALRITVNGRWNGTIDLDPVSGRELRRRRADQGMLQLVFDFHSSLLAGDRGKLLLAIASLGYLLMLASGLLLWWPANWRHAFKLRRDSGPLLATLDLHRLAGATLGVLVLVSTTTGAYLAWRPIANWVTALTGATPAPAPRFAFTPGPSSPDVEAALRSALAQWPHGRVSTVLVPPSADGAIVRMRVRLPDDPHPIGMSTVWLDGATGRVVAARRWSELDPGSRAFSVIYPLHTGTLGGPLTQILTFVAGTALAGYSVTGVWLWWRRRGARETGPQRR